MSLNPTETVMLMLLGVAVVLIILAVVV